MESLAISIFIVYIVIPSIVWIIFKIFGEKSVDKEFEKMKKSWR
ncbi:hypothetical protein [uncultured Succinivibrio sp.]|nr:hypothetical protein [uncultured Succinivibrio sp.]